MGSNSHPVVHPKGTVDKLFQELDRLSMSEKRGYIEDWLIHFGPHNPLYMESDNEGEVSVTFFVKEKVEDQWKNLFLVGDSFGWNEPQYEFKKIKNTDWWTIEFSRFRGSKLHYLFSPDEVGTTITKFNRKVRRKKWFFDVRNKLNVETVDRVHSVARFPGFVPSMDPGSKEIRLQNLRVPKKLEGNRVIKYGIANEKEDPEKLLIIHDGVDSIRYMDMTKVIKKGVDEGLWPNMLVLSLTINNEERTKEYGGKVGYPDYVADDIISSAENFLSLSFEPKDIIITGTSLGAWGAFDVVWHRNDRIKNIICQSSPFWWDSEDKLGHRYYIHEVEDNKKEKIGKIYLDVGVFEKGRKPVSTYDSNIQFANVLRKKRYKFMGRELLMGHRYHSWAWSFPSALDYIINDTQEFGPLPGREIAKEIK